MRTENVSFYHSTDIGFEYYCDAQIASEMEEGQRTHDVTLLNVFYLGMDGHRLNNDDPNLQPMEVFPYQVGFDWKTRIELERRAVEAYYDQAASGNFIEPRDFDNVAQEIEEAALSY